MNFDLFILNFWNEFKKIFCYYSGLRFVVSKVIKPWREYDCITDISINEIKKIIKDNKIKVIIVDMDGTLKYRKIGLLNENKKWISNVKKIANVYIISNANERRTSVIANELAVPYVHLAKKPCKRGFYKIFKSEKVKPGECIMIGDALVADIYGARRVNIEKTILVKDLNIFYHKLK